MSKAIFISWSGDLGKGIAEALRDTILCVPGLDPWVSSRDIKTGRPWFSELTDFMKGCHHAVVCLTPGGSYKAWVNFETGFVFGKLNQIVTLNFGENLTGPLKGIQCLDGFKKEDILSALQVFVDEKDYKKIPTWFDPQYSEWDSRVSALLKDSSLNVADFEEVRRETAEGLSAVTKSKPLLNNALLRSLVHGWARENATKLTQAAGSLEFSIPHFMYPHYLLSLLKDRKPTVKAIALVDREEVFWGSEIAEKIRQETPTQSTRVFIFQSKAQLRKTLSTVFRHAKSYYVSLMAQDFLANRFYDFAHDFSIIGGTQSTLLARYDEQGGTTHIKFQADQKEISRYEDAINQIIRSAVHVKLDPNSSYDDFERQFEDWARKVFDHNLGIYETKTVEMSAYIPIHDYDAYEEDHAYFKDMMEYMIVLCEQHLAKITGSPRALEFGAGTGIFTRRLAARIKSEIVAVEIDWACFRQMEHNLKPFPHVKCESGDSRVFDPPGKFDVICSSFADHHIKPVDKSKYFLNLIKNLNPNGVIIVGDEFLPEHDGNSAQSRREALRAYHEHIIKCAENLKHTMVAELEKAALDSGLREIGDFKLSCSQYEALLTESKFKFKKTKIGPSNSIDPAESFGGVYVYEITPSHK